EDESGIDLESCLLDDRPVFAHSKFAIEASDAIDEIAELSIAQREEMLAGAKARFGQVEPDERDVVASGPRHHRVRKVRIVQRLNCFVQTERAAHRDNDEAVHAEET